FVPVHLIELECVAFALEPVLGSSTAEIPGVVMKSNPIDGTQLILALAEDLLKEAARPFPVIIVRTRGNERQFLSELRHPSGVAAELNGILLRREIPSAAPGLVSNSPIAHVEGRGRPGGSPNLRECRAPGGRVTVLDPTIEIDCRKAANIGCEVRFRAH